MSFTFLSRAISDAGAISDVGTMICTRKANGKYSMFMPVAGIPATGSAPNKLDITVTTDLQEKQILGRQAAFDIELSANNTIDNKIRMNAIQNTTQDFLIFYGDGSGYRFSGMVQGWADAIDLNSVPKLALSVSVTRADSEFTINVMDLIEDIITFEMGINSTPYILATGTPLELAITTFPATATVTVTSSAASVATATVVTGKLTVTAVAAGTATITLSATSAGFASNFRAFNVVVKGTV